MGLDITARYYFRSAIADRGRNQFFFSNSAVLSRFQSNIGECLADVFFPFRRFFRYHNTAGSSSKISIFEPYGGFDCQLQKSVAAMSYTRLARIDACYLVFLVSVMPVCLAFPSL